MKFQENLIKNIAIPHFPCIELQAYDIRNMGSGTAIFVMLNPDSVCNKTLYGSATLNDFDANDIEKSEEESADCNGYRWLVESAANSTAPTFTSRNSMPTTKILDRKLIWGIVSGAVLGVVAVVIIIICIVMVCRCARRNYAKRNRTMPNWMIRAASMTSLISIKSDASVQTEAAFGSRHEYESMSNITPYSSLPDSIQVGVKKAPLLSRTQNSSQTNTLGYSTYSIKVGDSKYIEYS